MSPATIYPQKASTIQISPDAPNEAKLAAVKDFFAEQSKLHPDLFGRVIAQAYSMRFPEKYPRYDEISADENLQITWFYERLLAFTLNILNPVIVQVPSHFHARA